MPDTNETNTESLIAHLAGDSRAADALLPILYDELRGLAGKYLRGERVGHTLQPTALVNEAYIRLIKCDRMDWRGRAHFLAMAALTLRRILVEHARAKRADKRDADGTRLTLAGLADRAGSESTEFLALDQAVERLTRVSPLQGKIVELRFFGGLRVAEVAAVLDIGLDRVKSEWRFARVWLKRELERG